jgi:FkbM family methyltransferase
MDMINRDGYWWPGDITDKAVSFQLNNMRSLEKVLTYCPRRRGVVQAGGNLGLWPKRLSKEFNTVWTFEPDRPSFNVLVKNVEDCDNVIPMPIALVERTTFVSISHKGDSSHKIVGFREGTVPALPIDTFEYYYDCLILDLEGSELQALKGAQRSLSLHRPVIMLEIREEMLRFYGVKVPQIHELMAEFRYKQVDGIGHDFIFMPAEKVKDGV